jgi:hypothetical protein
MGQRRLKRRAPLRGHLIVSDRDKLIAQTDTVAVYGRVTDRGELVFTIVEPGPNDIVIRTGNNPSQEHAWNVIRGNIPEETRDAVEGWVADQLN